MQSKYIYLDGKKVQMVKIGEGFYRTKFVREYMDVHKVSFKQLSKMLIALQNEEEVTI